jgi:hypothetical protein
LSLFCIFLIKNLLKYEILLFFKKKKINIVNEI